MNSCRSKCIRFRWGEHAPRVWSGLCVHAWSSLSTVVTLRANTNTSTSTSRHRTSTELPCIYLAVSRVAKRIHRHHKRNREGLLKRKTRGATITAVHRTRYIYLAQDKSSRASKGRGTIVKTLKEAHHDGGTHAPAPEGPAVSYTRL